jgi:hypothetical protein
MTLATVVEPVLEAGVADFLKRHNAEAAFRTVCDLVRACFPELRAFKVWLLDDPDEEGRTWAKLHGFLPAAHPRDTLQAQRLSYYDQLVEQLSLEYFPLFALSLDSARE